MTVVAATKYVSVDELEALAAAGVEVVGENRAQDLEAKHARYGDRFRWHFIGHLQSRKAKTVSELCELCHSLGVRVGGEAADDSGARRGEPLGRADEVGHPARRARRASSSCTRTCAA